MNKRGGVKIKRISEWRGQMRNDPWFQNVRNVVFNESYPKESVAKSSSYWKEVFRVVLSPYI